MNRWIARAGLVGVGLSALAISAPMSSASATPVARLAAANAVNLAQAGYLVAASGSATVTDHFKVPTITCNAGVETAMGLGTIVFTSVGSPDASNVIAYCPGGGSSTPTYYGAFLTSGTITFATFNATAGDAMVATVTATAASVKMTLKDVTSAKSQTLKGPATAIEDAFWGAETYTNNNAILPVPTFTSVSFTKGTLGTSTVKATGAAANDLQETSKIDIHTGTLNTTGAGWKEVWKANS